jgi:hypothetical protein
LISKTCRAKARSKIARPRLAAANAQQAQFEHIGLWPGSAGEQPKLGKEGVKP